MLCSANRVACQEAVVGDSEIGVSSMSSRSQVPHRRSARLAQMAPQLYVEEHYDDARDCFDDNDKYMPNVDDTSTKEESPQASPDNHRVLATPARQCPPLSPTRSHVQGHVVVATNATDVSRPQTEP